MIKDVFCHIASLIETVGLFSKSYEYTELIQRNSSSGNKTIQPMYYEGGGWKPVQNFDVGGMFYLRKNGDPAMTTDTSRLTATPCKDDRNITITIPVTCVSAVLRDKFEDVRFADDILAQSIIEAIQGVQSTSGLNLQGLAVHVGSYSTDSYRIWNGENSGVDFKERDLMRFAYISINFNIIIKANASCLQSCSNPY